MIAALELVDVVAEDGSSLRAMTRAEMRAGNELHRAVFVAVITSTDAVVVHKRADWKDVWPSRWDVCFGGVVAAGESFDEAAVRELAEEAGVLVQRDDLYDLGAGRYEDGLVRELTRSYLVRSDGPFSVPDGEVVQIDRVPLTDLDRWVAERSMCPDSLELIVPHLRRAPVVRVAPA